MSYNDNYYFTFEEFLGLLSIAYEDAHGKQDTGIRCHPEDLYNNISIVLDVMCSTLSNTINLKSNRQMSSIRVL
jgi:hypothetical protein